MTVIAIFGAIAVVILGVVIAIAKAFAVDEARGLVQNRVRAKVEALIASLPPELQEEWGDEWRSELAAVISMPLTAIRFAKGLRRSTPQLGADPLPAAARDDRKTRIPSISGGAAFGDRLRWLSGPLKSYGVSQRLFRALYERRWQLMAGAGGSITTSGILLLLTGIGSPAGASIILMDGVFTVCIALLFTGR